MLACSSLTLYNAEMHPGMPCSILYCNIKMSLNTLHVLCLLNQALVLKHAIPASPYPAQVATGSNAVPLNALIPSQSNVYSSSPNS